MSPARPPPLAEMDVSCTVTDLNDVAGSARYVTDIYIFPGIRTGLGEADRWAAQFAMNIPVSGPQPYAWQPQFSLIKQW